MHATRRFHEHFPANGFPLSPPGCQKAASRAIERNSDSLQNTLRHPTGQPPPHARPTKHTLSPPPWLLFVIAAPVLVLLCDWIVLRTKPQDLVTKRLPLYAGLFACWPLVVAIVRLQADRYPESQGLGYGPLAYLANQPAVIVWYLRLAVWPTKLCFDYGWPVYRTWHLLAPWCVLVGTALAMATYFGIRRRLAGCRYSKRRRPDLRRPNRHRPDRAADAL